jgi:hypothetical protein
MPSVRLLDCALVTGSYAITQFNPVAAATDVWMLTGLIGKQTKIRWLEVGGTAVAARTQPVSLIKRSTATSGGTSTNPTVAIPDNLSGDVPTGVITQWTTLPGALGTALYTVDATTFSFQTGTAIQDRAVFNYEAQSVKPIVLGSSATQYLCVNFTGVATIATDKIDFEVWWTEQ